MKSNSKGFTLIELLAVIVILAVIALIATPLIMGVIDDARKGSAKNGAYGYVKAMENTIATEMIKRFHQLKTKQQLEKLYLIHVVMMGLLLQVQWIRRNQSIIKERHQIATL